MTMKRFGVGDGKVIEIEQDKDKKEAKSVEWTEQDGAELKKELEDSDDDKTEDEDEEGTC